MIMKDSEKSSGTSSAKNQQKPFGGPGLHFRRQFLINPRFQFTIIGFNVGLAALSILVFYLATHYLFEKFTATGSTDGTLDPIIVQMIADERARMNLVFFFTSVVVLGIMGIGGLVLSNRVAGPVYRLQRHMENIMKGADIGAVKFRKKDFLPELADTFNKFLTFFLKK